MKHLESFGQKSDNFDKHDIIDIIESLEYLIQGNNIRDYNDLYDSSEEEITEYSKVLIADADNFIDEITNLKEELEDLIEDYKIEGYGAENE